jgi:segregation and condensation protein A
MSLAGRYLVQLPHFEGPLALLLYLIRKEEMDIFNININGITKQYLDHIRMMKELDLDVAGEFVAMAATLIQIKAKMLVPQYNDEGEVVETEDPRKELVQKLLDYQLYQDAAKKLYDRPLLKRDVWARGIREDLRSDDEGLIIIEDEGLFGLIASYRKAMKKAERLIHRVRPKTQSIAGRVLEISHRLSIGAKVLLRDLLNIGPETYRTQLLITFLSMLEMGRLGFVSVFQNETYGDIHIELKKNIERNILERVQEFDSADADSIANSIISSAVADSEDIGEMQDQAASGPQASFGDMMVQAIEPEEISIDTFGDVAHGSTPDVASDDDLLLAEKELGLSEDAPLAVESSLDESSSNGEANA